MTFASTWPYHLSQVSCVLLSMWECVFSGAQPEGQYLYPANMLTWEQEEVPGETELILLVS